MCFENYAHLHFHSSINTRTASVLFDFDMCDYTNLLKTSIQSLSFTGVLNTIIDTSLDPVLDKASFLPEDFTNDIKSTIVSAADTKVNEVKNTVVNQIGALIGNCARRRLGEIELSRGGSQRFPEADLTFNAFAASIQVMGVVELVSLLFCFLSLKYHFNSFSHLICY